MTIVLMVMTIVLIVMTIVLFNSHDYSLNSHHYRLSSHDYSLNSHDYSIIIRKKVINPPTPFQYIQFFISPSELETGKNTNEQRVITDYMQDISKRCRL